jgi:hypothetical protein
VRELLTDLVRQRAALWRLAGEPLDAARAQAALEAWLPRPGAADPLGDWLARDAAALRALAEAFAESAVDAKGPEQRQTILDVLEAPADPGGARRCRPCSSPRSSTCARTCSR